MNNLKKNINGRLGLSLAVAVILFVITSLQTSPSVSAAPFICEPAFYQSLTGTLKKLDPLTGQYTTLGSTALYLNAIGFNTEDNYIYGLNNSPGGSTLMRVDSDGSYTDLGLPTGLPSTGSVVGDFDHSGNLYVLVNSPDSSVYKIDITADTATEIPMSANLSINDFAYIDGYLYGTNGTSLYRIDVDTGTVATTTLGLPSATYGAAWSTVDDRLYFSQNISGVIYEVTDYDTVSPDPIAVLQGEANLVGNDGASCSLAPTVILDLVANNDTASTSFNTTFSAPQNTGLLSNDIGSNLSVTSYTQPANGTVTVNPDGSYSYTPNSGFIGVDTFQYTVTDSVNNTATATVSITVAPQAPSAGNNHLIRRHIVLALATISAGILIVLAYIRRLSHF